MTRAKALRIAAEIVRDPGNHAWTLPDITAGIANQLDELTNELDELVHVPGVEAPLDTIQVPRLLLERLAPLACPRSGSFDACVWCPGNVRENFHSSSCPWIEARRLLDS